MADEAVILELLGNNGDQVRMTVADAIGIPKGTLCYLLDPYTASGSHAGVNNMIFAGIASSEKVANDGQTSIGLITNCIADLKDSGTGITAGDWICLSAANMISGANTAIAGKIMGRALETAAASETIACRVRV